MKDEDKTKEQLISELKELRRENEKLRAIEAEWKEAGGKLREHEERYRQIFNHMTDGVAVYEGVGEGEDFIFKDFNTAAERIEGVARRDVLGKSVSEVFPGVREFGLFEVFQRVWRTGEPKHLPVRLYRDERARGWKENYVYKLSSGEIVAVYNDVTPQKQAEEALRESEKRYRTLFENSHSVMLLIDPETAEIVDANPRACSFYGYRYEELLKCKITEINTLAPEQINVEMERSRTEQRNYFNFRHRLANGEIRDVEVYSGPIGIGGRQLLFSVIHDETERRRTEELLRQSEIKYRTIFETTGTATIIAEKDTTISLINNEFAKLSGYSKEEVEEKKSWTQFFSADDLAKMREWHRLRRIDPTAAPRNYEARFTDRDGCIRNVFLTVALIPGTTKSVGSLLDITECKRMEEELLKARKLESVGILAGGIAHDFNNLLGIIMGYINLTAMNLPDGHPALRLLTEAERGSIQAKDLVQRFLSLATGGNLIKVRSSIAEAMPGKVNPVLSHSSIEAEYDFPPDLWQVEIDPYQMREAIRNVIVNAAEAMPRGGTLRIKAGNIEVADGGRKLGLPMKDGRYVKVSIRDQGIGIREENLGKIFDPYFSTKDRGSIKGMGLGLAITYSVISKHGGIISVESETGLGTSISIYIPAI